MQYSPKLKRVMDELKKIIESEDIGAVVVIHTPGFSEQFTHITPSYSCAKIETQNGRSAIRFRAKSSDHDGDKDKVRKLVTATSNMMMHLSTLTTQQAIALTDASEMLDVYVDAHHTKGNSSSHTEQNN